MINKINKNKNKINKYLHCKIRIWFINIRKFHQWILDVVVLELRNKDNILKYHKIEYL